MQVKLESGIKQLTTSKQAKRFKGCIAEDNTKFDHMRQNE
jgi:hypothetical protein